MILKRILVAITLAASAGLPLAAQWPAAEKIDLDAVYRIKEEGLDRSQVMETASYLTDVYGPRLTGSPDTKEAADWAQKTMKSWGLSNVHTEKWMFGRGWRNERMFAMALTPRPYPLIAYPKAWTPGTNGPVTGDAVIAVISEEKDFEIFRGQLRGLRVSATAAARRRTSSPRDAATPTASLPTCRNNRRRAAAVAETRRPR